MRRALLLRDGGHAFNGDEEVREVFYAGVILEDSSSVALFFFWLWPLFVASCAVLLALLALICIAAVILKDSDVFHAFVVLWI